MSELDIRRIAEREVEKLHISDLEWKEVLIDQYAEILRQATKPPEYIRPFLIVSNSQYRH